MKFEAREMDNDVRLGLSRTDEGSNVLSWLFSPLCAVSTSRPWNLVAQEFRSVSVTDTTETVRIHGRSDSLETESVFSFRGSLLQVTSRWVCTSAAPLDDLAVALVLELRHDPATERVTMPHILYNDNPSADPSRLVPHFGKDLDACLVCEETRFPIPCVNVEWLEGDTPLFVSLHSVPNGGDVDWSLGCIRGVGGIRVVCASGVLALNGVKDETYGSQARSVHLENGYRRMKRGETLEKTCVVEFGEAERVGWGFRRVVSSGYEILRPKASPCLSLDEVIELKANALDNRWHADANSSGFLCLLPGNVYDDPPYYLFGWTGQNFRLAWCSAKLGIEKGDVELVDRCRQVVDFYVRNSDAQARGLRYNYYYIDERCWKGSWVGAISSRAHGEATANLGRIIRLFRSSGLEVPSEWVESLRASADFFLAPSAMIREGIFPLFWRPDGSPATAVASAAGIPCVLGMLGAYSATDDRRCLDGAVSMLARYWEMWGDRFDRPFARATLDAKCEDSEAGIYFFLAAYELYCITGEPRFKQWAEVAADWILTFVYFWHTGFRPGTTCADKEFVTTGWPGVSVQNHHLDVFFPAFELYDFGRRAGNARYEQFGRMVFDAWSHGICRTPGDWEHNIPGEQGEQFYQTNYYQGRFGPEAWRGGYNRWNPSWIVTLVLEAALSFRFG